MHYCVRFGVDYRLILKKQRIQRSRLRRRSIVGSSYGQFDGGQAMKRAGISMSLFRNL